MEKLQSGGPDSSGAAVCVAESEHNPAVTGVKGSSEELQKRGAGESPPPSLFVLPFGLDRHPLLLDGPSLCL